MTWEAVEDALLACWWIDEFGLVLSRYHLLEDEDRRARAFPFAFDLSNH